LLQKVAATPLARLSDPWLYLSYESSVLIVYGLVYGVARWAGRLPVAASAICALAAAWGNVGYMGVPLLIAAYGENHALASVLAVVLDNLVLQSVTILLVEASLGAHKGGLRTVMRAVARNPLILAVLAGAAQVALGLRLPAAANGFLSLLGAAAAPSALFALGATLRGATLASGLRLVAAISAAKLLVLPAIA